MNANVCGVTNGSAQGIYCVTFVKSRVGPIFYYPLFLCLISMIIVMNKISITLWITISITGNVNGAVTLLHIPIITRKENTNIAGGIFNINV